jgi:hypothetical protein
MPRPENRRLTKSGSITGPHSFGKPARELGDEGVQLRIGEGARIE